MGLALGLVLGLALGLVDGDALGCCVGEFEGDVVGHADGLAVGYLVHALELVWPVWKWGVAPAQPTHALCPWAPW